MRNTQEGITILLKYIEISETAYIAAKDDRVMFSGPRPDKMESGDFHRLGQLGFFYDMGTESWGKLV